MGNVYYPNAILLIFPALEVVHLLFAKQRDAGQHTVPIQKMMLRCGVFLAAFFASLFPTFITRQIIYGSPFETGYPAISDVELDFSRVAQGFVFLRSRDV